MNIGLVMPVFVGTPERSHIVSRCLTSLAKTSAPDHPYLVLLEKSSPYLNMNGLLDSLGKTFVVLRFEDIPGDVNSRDVYMADMMFLNPEVSHVVFLYSDFVFNSQWLTELKKLILRHPDARAWSVYRSAYTRHHRIVGGDGVDVLMTMHDGLGCLSREEWEEYKIHINGDYTCPATMGGGSTIDIHHPYKRPGEYWATSRDYWENLGRHAGIEKYDCAIDFVGED